jgi:rhodanese-related sulfurtransferase
MSLPAISPSDAERLIAQGATLIDIREPDEHAREHIQGARNVPLQARNVPSQALGKLGGATDPIIFHCRAGTRTADSAARLKDAAACEAYLLAGGIDAWKQAGLPVIADRSQPIEFNRQVMIAAGSLVLLGALLGSLVHPGFYALSGLIGAGLIFAGLSGWCGLAKLFGVMPWNQRTVGV